MTLSTQKCHFEMKGSRFIKLCAGIVLSIIGTVELCWHNKYDIRGIVSLYYMASCVGVLPKMPVCV